MASFESCSGAQRPAINTRTVRGAEGKFFRMNGVTFGHCPECGRTSLRVNKAGNVPAHKVPVTS